MVDGFLFQYEPNLEDRGGIFVNHLNTLTEASVNPHCSVTKTVAVVCMACSLGKVDLLCDCN